MNAQWISRAAVERRRSKQLFELEAAVDRELRS